MEQIKTQDAPCLISNSTFLGPQRFQTPLPSALGPLKPPWDSLRAALPRPAPPPHDTHPPAAALHGVGAGLCRLPGPSWAQGLRPALPEDAQASAVALAPSSSGVVPNATVWGVGGTERAFFRLPC